MAKKRNKSIDHANENGYHLHVLNNTQADQPLLTGH